MNYNVFNILKNWKQNNVENRTWGDINTNKIDDRDFLGFDDRDNIDYTEIYESIKENSKHRLCESGGNNSSISINLYSNCAPSGITKEGKFIQIM